MLNLLLRQPYAEEDIRTDFIDYCLMRLADSKLPYAIRALCIKLAYEQMKHFIYPALHGITQFLVFDHVKGK